MGRELEQNIAVMWSNSVKSFSGKECVRVLKDGEWRSMTYKVVDERIRGFALGLVALGLAPGARLALLSENRPKWAFTDLATQAVGGILTAIYNTNTPKDVEFIILDSGAEIVAVSNYFQLKKVLESRKLDKTLKHIVIFDPIKDLTDKDPRVLTFEEVINLGMGYRDHGVLGERMNAVRQEDVATLIYTSGATGASKGVMLTHANLLANMHEAQELFRLAPSDVCLSILPLSHSLERTAGHFAPFYAGASIAYAESITAMGENLLDVKPTAMVGVPRIFEKMHARIVKRAGMGGNLKRRTFDWAISIGRQTLRYRLKGKRVPAYLDLQYRLADNLAFRQIRAILGGHIRFMISGGAPLAKEVAEFFYAVGIPIYEGYGLTESSPVVSANFPGNVKLGTVGRPLAGVEVKIAPDGEILVRGPNVMKGYWNLPIDTREAIEGGWLHTGDIGVIDRDGFIAITDRKKDIIVTSGGKNIAPQSIETLLTMDDYINQACVLGDRRPFLTAIIVPNFEEVQQWAKAKGLLLASNKDLIANPEVKRLIEASVEKVNAQLARFETIKKFLLTDEDFTVDNALMTPTMKIRRKAVDTLFAHRIDQLY